MFRIWPRRLCRAGVYGSCLAGLVTVAAYAPAAATAVPRGGSGWRVAARVTVPGATVIMLSVAPTPRDQAWATGLSVKRSGRDGRLVIERWSGHGWRPAPVPARMSAAFGRPAAGYSGPPFPVAAASSPGNTWIFNQITGAWLRWDGRRWSDGVLPGRGGGGEVAVTSALAAGSRGAWAFGGRLTARGTLTPWAAQRRRGRWVVTAMPAGLPKMLVSAVSAAGPDDIWATIGYGGQVIFPAQGNGGALARWDGHRWHRMRLPAALAATGDPTSVLAASSRDVWVGGGVANSKEGLTEAIAHWDGSRWRVTRVPAAASRANCVLRSLVARRAGVLGLGVCLNFNGSISSRLWQLADGQWSSPATPSLAGRRAVLLDLAGAGHAAVTWGTGNAGNAGVIAASGPVR